MSESDPDLKNTNEIPNHVIVSLARVFLPEIQAFYSSDKGKAFLAQLNMEDKIKSTRT